MKRTSIDDRTRCVVLLHPGQHENTLITGIDCWLQTLVLDWRPCRLPPKVSFSRLREVAMSRLSTPNPKCGLDNGFISSSIELSTALQLSTSFHHVVEKVMHCLRSKCHLLLMMMKGYVPHVPQKRLECHVSFRSCGSSSLPQCLR